MNRISELKRVGKVESDLVKVGTIVYDNGADSYYIYTDADDEQLVLDNLILAGS